MTAAPCWQRATTLAIAAAIFSAPPTPAAAQLGDSIPSQSYYAGIDQLYRGDYRGAERAFQRSLRGSVKSLSPDGTIYWVDSICYHAMLGEVYFQWGQPRQALDQFNQACALYLQYPRWLLQVDFAPAVQPSSSLARVRVPWGARPRPSVPGHFPDTMRVAQGTINNSGAVARGGVLVQAQYWPVNVAEVLRATALAIRRRNEILGPVGQFDRISRDLVLSLSRGVAPPNHWSRAWIDVLRGLAHAGVNEPEQAQTHLQRGAVADGQFDHPLTAIALVELGRLALEAKSTEDAGRLFADASQVGFIFEDATVIDDAFRWGQINRIAAGARGPDPTLPPAIAWANRENFDHIACRLQLAVADELMASGDWRNAAVALAAGQSALDDARTGILGNVALFLEGKLDYQQGRSSGPQKLTAAVNGRRPLSLHNLQVSIANDMFDDQTMPSRSAVQVYDFLLSDPSPAEALLNPLETMAVMSTRHDGAFERWLIATLERRNLNAAVEVTDHAKRRRFHYALPWGGRLAAVRTLLCSPQADVQHQQRGELLQRYPDFSDTLSATQQLRQQIDAAWRPAPTDAQRRDLARLWNQYDDALEARELQLGRIALARVPASLSFPPRLDITNLQAQLQPGQAVLVYHDSPAGLLGFLFTSSAASNWNCGPSGRVATQVARLLRELGNSDANRKLNVEDLASVAWHEASADLYRALFEGSGLGPSALKELIVIPDGVVWYVPFEALLVDVEGETGPLISFAKVRYAPTVGLAFSFEEPWRRVRRTGLAAGDLLPGDSPEARTESIAPLQAVLENAIALDSPLPASSPAVASLLDAAVVMDDIEAQGSGPLAWSPLPADRSAHSGALGRWLALAGEGPQRILLPGMHTMAERGGRAASRRRGGDSMLPGSELFYASCGLMSAGAETLLLSRWRVGGQSTLDLVREFAQEMPHAPAADAWQRSVQLLMQSPLDVANEPRLTMPKEPVEVTASHPLFWAGYLVVDSGWRLESETPVENEQPEANPAAAQAPPAAAAGVPPKPAGEPADDEPDAVPEDQAPDDDSPEDQSPQGSPPPRPTPPAAGRRSPQ